MFRPMSFSPTSTGVFSLQLEGPDDTLVNHTPMIIGNDVPGQKDDADGVGEYIYGIPGVAPGLNQLVLLGREAKETESV